MVADIYEDHKICDYGFDPILLCKKMGYSVLPYESFYAENEEEKRLLLEKQDEDGFSWFNPRLQKCEIYYNSNRKPWLRYKFTIPHELGHIEFGHVFKEEITKRMEEIADEFSRQIYVPQILLYKKKILTVNEIMTVFDITEGYAAVIQDRLENRINYHGTEFSENEY